MESSTTFFIVWECLRSDFVIFKDFSFYPFWGSQNVEKILSKNCATAKRQDVENDLHFFAIIVLCDVEIIFAK
jgi:hypothetical protein